MKMKKMVLAALSIALLSGVAALAQGRGKSDEARSDVNNGNGATASELKWRNAAHASAQALLNANSGSSVGRLATFKDATLAAEGAALAVQGAYEAAGVDPDADPRLAEDILFDIADALLAIADAEIAGMDVGSGEYLALLADWVTLEAELALEDALVDLIAAEATTAESKATADADIGIEDLSEDAITALWALLGD
jgi:hypothetical protein